MSTGSPGASTPIVAADTGGKFTDLVLLNDGRIRTLKVPSTPADPSQAVLDGLRLLLPDGEVARLERTSAFTRAARVVRPGEDLDDAVDAVSGTWWFEGREEGFTWHADPRPEPESAEKGPRKPQDRGGPDRNAVDTKQAEPQPKQAAPAPAPKQKLKQKRSLRQRLTGG